MQIILLVITLILASCNSAKRESLPDTAPIAVLAVKPTLRDVPLYIESIGTLKPEVHAEVRAEVEGTIRTITVKDGQAVQKGDLLVALDTKRFAIKAKEIQAEIARDKATLQAAKRKLTRFKTLADKELISKAEWDEYIHEARRAKAELAKDKARLMEVRHDISRSKIRSPISGIVGKIDIHAGQMINTSSNHLLTISKIDQLIVECHITEKDHARLSQKLIQDTPLDIGIQSLVTEELKAKASLYYVDPHFEKTSGRLLLRARVDNPETKFRPGLGVRVRLPIDVVRDASMIPQKAVKFNEAGPYLYVIDSESAVQLRKVVLGDQFGTEIVIKEGLQPEEQVITDGHLRLYPGVKVRVSG